MSLGTIEGWIAYASAVGDSVENNALSQQALVRGQRYIKSIYITRFIPPNDENSIGVDEAVYEAAKLELATPNFFNTTYTPSQQRVLTGVDSIRWTVVTPESRNRAAIQATPTSTIIDGLLSNYLAPETGTYPFLRSIA